MKEVRRLESEKGRFTLIFLATPEDMAGPGERAQAEVELTYNWDPEEYAGGRPDDAWLAPYWSRAEELDVPVGIHMGPGPPGAAYLGATAYRMGLSDPLQLENVLLHHPKLRLYVMHAGWPMADRMIALLYAHPQVYVDTGVIDWTQPRAEFYAYLKRLVEAGYGERVMFGSDQMIWPDAIPAAIDAIRSAAFLTNAQKKLILHDNAMRFFRGKLP